MRNAFWAGIVMVLAVGCDSKSDEVKLADFGQQSANAVCDKVYECCSLTDTELMAHMGYSGGRAACGTKNKDSMGFWAAVIGQEQERGRLAYDPKLAHRCLEAFAATSCEGHKSNAAAGGLRHLHHPEDAGRLALQGQRVLHRRQLRRQRPRQGGRLPGVRHREHLVRGANLRQGPALRWQASCACPGGPTARPASSTPSASRKAATAATPTPARPAPAA